MIQPAAAFPNYVQSVRISAENSPAPLMEMIRLDLDSLGYQSDKESPSLAGAQVAWFDQLHGTRWIEWEMST
jgi:hypothetical protein